MYSMLAEKRRGQRVLVNLQANYRSPTVVMEGRIANLSRYGLFLRSEFLDDEGSEVRIDLTLPGEEEPLRIAGEVVRVDTSPTGSGMGIRFHRLDDAIRRALANFMIERSYAAPV